MAHRSAAGTHYRPHPADFAILERLPREGSLIGYHVLAATVKRLREDLNKDVPEGGRLTSEQVSARLVSMKYAKLVTTTAVMGSGSNVGWQRTRKGELHYAEHTGRQLAVNGPGDAPLQIVEGGANQ